MSGYFIVTAEKFYKHVTGPMKSWAVFGGLNHEQAFALVIEFSILVTLVLLQ